MADPLAVMASSAADYERLGLSPTSIEPREDGARTDDSAGTYEWWYFDAHLASSLRHSALRAGPLLARSSPPLTFEAAIGAIGLVERVEFGHVFL